MTMGDAKEEKQAILKQLEYSTEISNPLGGRSGTTWNSRWVEAITSFMSIENGLTVKINEIGI